MKCNNCANYEPKEITVKQAVKKYGWLFIYCAMVERGFYWRNWL